MDAQPQKQHEGINNQKHESNQLSKTIQKQRSKQIKQIQKNDNPSAQFYQQKEKIKLNSNYIESNDNTLENSSFHQHANQNIIKLSDGTHFRSIKNIQRHNNNINEQDIDDLKVEKIKEISSENSIQIENASLVDQNNDNYNDSFNNVNNLYNDIVLPPKSLLLFQDSKSIDDAAIQYENEQALDLIDIIALAEKLQVPQINSNNELQQKTEIENLDKLLNLSLADSRVLLMSSTCILVFAITELFYQNYLLSIIKSQFISIADNIDYLNAYLFPNMEKDSDQSQIQRYFYCNIILSCFQNIVLSILGALNLNTTYKKFKKLNNNIAFRQHQNNESKFFQTITQNHTKTSFSSQPVYFKKREVMSICLIIGIVLLLIFPQVCINFLKLKLPKAQYELQASSPLNMTLQQASSFNNLTGSNFNSQTQIRTIKDQYELLDIIHNDIAHFNKLHDSYAIGYIVISLLSLVFLYWHFYQIRHFNLFAHQLDQLIIALKLNTPRVQANAEEERKESSSSQGSDWSSSKFHEQPLQRQLNISEQFSHFNYPNQQQNESLSNFELSDLSRRQLW